MTALARALVLADGLSLVPVATRTTNLTGTGLSLKDYEGTVLVILHGLRTTGDLTVSLEHSDVLGSGYVASPAGALDTAFTIVDSGTSFIQVRKLDIAVCKDFIRGISVAANTPSHTYGISVVGVKKAT